MLHRDLLKQPSAYTPKKKPSKKCPVYWHYDLSLLSGLRFSGVVNPMPKQIFSIIQYLYGCPEAYEVFAMPLLQGNYCGISRAAVL